MPRPRRKRLIERDLHSHFYKPQAIKLCDLKIITLTKDQLEAIRLADSEELDQEQAANQMNISRSTFSRLVAEARKIVASALVNGWAIKIEGGDFEINNQE